VPTVVKSNSRPLYAPYPPTFSFPLVETDFISFSETIDSTHLSSIGKSNHKAIKPPHNSSHVFHTHPKPHLETVSESFEKAVCHAHTFSYPLSQHRADNTPYDVTKQITNISANLISNENAILASNYEADFESHSSPDSRSFRSSRCATHEQAHSFTYSCTVCETNNETYRYSYPLPVIQTFAKSIFSSQRNTFGYPDLQTNSKTFGSPFQ
jgi:hypothetical protein